MEVAPIRSLVVDGSEPWRCVVSAILRKCGDCEIVGEAADGMEAVQKIQLLQPDLTLLDLGLPKLNGIEAARQIKAIAPQCRILFLTQVYGQEIIEEALQLGAHGYVLKCDAAHDLPPAVEAAMRNERFMSKSFTEFGLA